MPWSPGPREFLGLGWGEAEDQPGMEQGGDVSPDQGPQKSRVPCQALQHPGSPGGWGRDPRQITKEPRNNGGSGKGSAGFIGGCQPSQK